MLYFITINVCNILIIFSLQNTTKQYAFMNDLSTISYKSELIRLKYSVHKLLGSDWVYGKQSYLLIVCFPD